MTRRFFKMQGAGNDYIYFDCRKEPISSPEALAVRLSDRHFSVGGDGIVLILPSSVADARMRMFNADGSEGNMCGNAIRCVGKFLYERGNVRKDVLKIETNAGIKTLRLHIAGDRVEEVTVDMGAPVLFPPQIPACFAGDRAVDVPLEAGGRELRVTCLSMGNPHCVTFCSDPAGEVAALGPIIEHHPAFPARVNAEFVKVLSRSGLEMRVWERGSGETLACGTGACAAAVAAVLCGLCDRDAEISVRLAGGTLKIRYTGETVYLTGPAEFAFTGEADI